MQGVGEGRLGQGEGMRGRDGEQTEPGRGVELASGR